MKPEDEAVVETLAVHEAERQDMEARSVAGILAGIRIAVARTIAIARQPEPDRVALREAVARIVAVVTGARKVSRDMARKLVTRQAREKKAVLDKRSGKRVTVPHLSKAEIERRVEDARKRKDPAV